MKKRQNFQEGGEQNGAFNNTRVHRCRVETAHPNMRQDRTFAQPGDASRGRGVSRGAPRPFGGFLFVCGLFCSGLRARGQVARTLFVSARRCPLAAGARLGDKSL